MADTMVVDIDLNKTRELGDVLIDQFSAARERSPIVWSDPSRCWLVLRHADVLEGFQGKKPLSAVRFTPQMVEPILGGPWGDHIPMIGRFVPHWVTNVDGPDHLRMRTLIAKSLTRPVVENLRPYVRERIGELLDFIDSRDGEVEFVEEVGRELPGRVILRLMGVSDELFPRLKGWANAITAALGSGIPTFASLRAAEEVIADMTSVFGEIVAKRRANPRGDDDFISLLLRATDENGRLSEDEMLGLMQLTVFAGHDTTLNSMSLGLVGLSRNPSQWAQLREHPDNIENAVQEIMRVTATSTAQNRTATEDFVWHGAHIKKGDPVFLVIASGNRDPRVFDHPDAMDVTRNVSDSLVFGPGLHFCLGHLLGRMQLGEFFSALTQRFDSVEVLDKQLLFNPPVLFRGLDELNVRFKKRAA